MAEDNSPSEDGGWFGTVHLWLAKQLMPVGATEMVLVFTKYTILGRYKNRVARGEKP